MNSFILLILGVILLNSMVQLIPMFYPDLDPGLYIPYQLWINVLLVFNWLLPSRKGLYLFKNIDENIVDGGVAVLIDDNSHPTAPPSKPTSREDDTPSAPPPDNNASRLTTELNPDGSFPSNYDIYASRAD